MKSVTLYLWVDSDLLNAYYVCMYIMYRMVSVHIKSTEYLAGYTIVVRDSDNPSL